MNSADSVVGDLGNTSRRDSADAAELMATQVYQSKSTESHRQCADLIFQSCKSLNLSIMVAGTALAYLHRLLKHYGVEDLSGKYLKSGIPALIYLACKTREELIPIKDIFNVVYVLRVGDDDPERLYNVYSQAKRDIILIEHEIIRILAFKFDVDLPHPYLLNFARMMNLSSHCVQLALNMLNESLLSVEWLTLSAPALACAALNISLQFIRSDGRDDRLTLERAEKWIPENHWWRAFGVPDEDVQSSTSALLSTAC